MTTRLSALLIALLMGLPALADAGPRRARLSGDLQDELRKGNRRTVEVIVAGGDDVISRLLSRHPLQLKRRLKRGAVLAVPAGQLDALAADAEVAAVAANAVVTSHMALTTATTGADAAWAGLVNALGAVDGSGIGVAIVDSGIAAHSALAGKVVVSVDFTRNRGRGIDGYGHGTHIAGIVAGQGIDKARKSGAAGMAPGAHLINLRVLDDSGAGQVADVVEALDWAIDNRLRYNIRVINLSLGTPVTQSYKDDPMGQAVERAVKAGIVVVASAGNRGETSDGKTVLSSISSPGNSPYAITVGALRSNGTADRSDDTLAPWSSRGPTPIDHLVKPDIAAPGSLIESTNAKGSTLATLRPDRVRGQGNASYITLSGTSMSAAVVSGAVALLLDGNPRLTPLGVRLALQASADWVPEAGLLGAGAGSLNLTHAMEGTQTLPARTAADLFPASWGAKVNGDVKWNGLRGQTIIWGDSII